MAALREIVEVGEDRELRLRLEPGEYEVVIRLLPQERQGTDGLVDNMQTAVTHEWPAGMKPAAIEFLKAEGITPEAIAAARERARPATGPLVFPHIEFPGWPDDATFSRAELYDDDDC